MPKYMQLGSIPPKRHTIHPNVPGYRNEGIYYEEVITTQGFSRAYSIVYHLKPPTRVVRVEAAGNSKIELADWKTLRHVHLKSSRLEPFGDPVTGRIPMLINADVILYRCRPSQNQAELYRNIFLFHAFRNVNDDFILLVLRKCSHLVWRIIN